tara:strand:+ start:858 stop:1499 length:642 start_codon:yes stop_codon:yes gene_type:complete
MKIKLNVPTELGEIKLSDYVKYLKVLEVNQDDDYSDVFVHQKILDIFCGVPLIEAVEYKMSDVRKVVGTITNTLNQKPELVKTFKLGDTEFGFIPKLDDMTFGEYVDLDSNLGSWDNMYKAMAVLYRPVKQKIKDKYLIDDYKGDLYYDAMVHTPMDAVVSSMLFFYNLGKELSIAMTKYLEEENLLEDSVLSQTSLINGDGINQYKHLADLI